MAELLIGYDVESLNIEGRGMFSETRAFLKQALKLHREMKVPCTLFVCGKTLEGNVEQFREVKDEPLFEIQQHTYSHEGPVLKTLVIEEDGKISVWEGMSLEEIRREVSKTNELLKKHLGVNCIGLRGPWGYYRGLSDRPDILRILHSLGIRFVSTYARNERDSQPVDFSVQPFWYSAQKLPDMLEIPVQYWQDLYLREKVGWKNRQGYMEEMKKGIDEIVRRNLTWGYATHDHSSIREDPEMEIVKRIIEYARSKGVRMLSYRQFYEEKRGSS